MTAACPGCEGERTQTFRVEGLDCAAEAELIEHAFRGLEGVCSVRASPLTGRATVVHRLEPGAVERVFRKTGFRVEEPGVASGHDGARGTLTAAALAAAGLLAGMVRPEVALLFYVPAILIGGAPVARKALQRLRQGALDMNGLMTVAVSGAMAIGEWGEAATTVVLFSLAQLLEARSLERARRAISGLLSLAPETAFVRRAGGEQRVPAATVDRGETIIVRPGQRLPLDGIVETGASAVDQSPITGESEPVLRQAGDEVFAGSINGGGVLSVRVTRPAPETMLARIMRRVEEAQASRAPSQGFVDAFARVYTPVVLVLAALTATLPPLAWGGSFQEWSYRALVLLVIACPCALVISTPVSIVSALTAASRRGVLVKGGAHLEQMGRLRGVVFDKTGTLTRGLPEVTDVLAVGASPREVLALAAAVEARSAHPVAAAVLTRARADGVAVEPALEASDLPGRGARGRVDGREVLVGSHRLFEERGLCDHRLDAELQRLEAEGKTAVLVGAAPAGQPGACAVAGALAVADSIRPEAPETIAALHREGLLVAMLTGDNARTAEAIARRLDIDAPRADLLPEDKVLRLAELQRTVGPMAMVGDGINDAPALAAAAVGVAMGGRGADAALETADVALMSDDLRRLPDAIRLGRAARDVIRQNIALSLGVKALVLALAVAGYGSLWAAVAADMGASLLVIGNGLRLLRAADGRRGG